MRQSPAVPEKRPTPTALIGAIIGGATFGDNISPVSDTTIASAATQHADLGGVVRSRLKYALAAAALAIVGYVAVGSGAPAEVAAAPSAEAATTSLEGSPKGLPMLLAPGLVLALLLTRQHLIEGLTFGIMAATVIALSLGLIAPNQLMDIDTDNFIAKGIILDGMERGIGVSFFTILLMGLVGGIEATGLVNRLVESARDRIHTVRQAEVWIFTTVSAVVLLLSHSTVAILTVGRFVKDTGEGFGTSRYRRANILDITVSTYPFLLPFFVPTFLTASTTAAGEAFGLPRISPLEVGLYNLHSWALLLVVVVAIVTGWGREMEE